MCSRARKRNKERDNERETKKEKERERNVHPVILSASQMDNSMLFCSSCNAPKQ